MDNIELPEGYKIVRDYEAVPITKQEQIDDLLLQKSQLPELGQEPTEQELVEMGRASHPYYMIKMQYDMIDSQLKELEE